MIFDMTKILDTNCYEMHSLLYRITKALMPKNYLEIGVFEGLSMTVVLKASPETQGYGIDLWNKYTGVTNTLDSINIRLLENGIKKMPVFFSGKSQILLPDLWNKHIIPELFDLILVDGDHAINGARKDLELCISHLAPSGFLFFHDISHEKYTYLADLVLSFKRKMHDFLFIESYAGNGFCLMIKYPIYGGLLWKELEL